MTSISSFSSSPLYSGATELLRSMRAELDKAQLELSSGKLSDIGLSLGTRTDDVLRLKVDQLRFTTTRDANALAKGRLDVVQSSLADITQIAQDYSGALLASRDSENTTLPVIGTAVTSLNALFDRLNASYDGVYVFSGTNSSSPPMSDYFAASPPSDARQAVAAAFMATFGMSQTDPAVSTISAADMQAFLDGPFADLFADPGWGQNWTSASSDNMLTRVSTYETVETTTNTGNVGLRKLTASMVMLADLGIEGMASETRRVILNAASENASNSLAALSTFQGEVGDRQARIKAATDRLDIQVNFVKAQYGSLVDVDPTEAAVRASDLMQRLQATYTLTGRLMSLSLLDSI